MDPNSFFVKPSVDMLHDATRKLTLAIHRIETSIEDLRSAKPDDIGLLDASGILSSTERLIMEAGGCVASVSARARSAYIQRDPVVHGEAGGAK